MAGVPHPVEEHAKKLEEHHAEEEDHEDEVDGVQLKILGILCWESCLSCVWLWYEIFKKGSWSRCHCCYVLAWIKCERSILTENAVKFAKRPVHRKPFLVVESDLHQEDREDEDDVAEEKGENCIESQCLQI